jgi:hypothetical protein
MDMSLLLIPIEKAENKVFFILFLFELQKKKFFYFNFYADNYIQIK